MDPLTQALLERAMSQQAPYPQQAPPPQQAPIPQQVPPAQQVPSVPPNPHTKVPQADKRFANAQAMAQAYQGDWTPNPVLLRAQLGHK